MKAQLWKISVVDGMLGMSHGMFYQILEIHVPELKLSMNEMGPFEFEDDRYQATNNDPDFPSQKPPEMVAEYDIPDDVVPHLQLLKDSISTKSLIDEKMGELFQKELQEAEKEESPGIEVISPDILAQLDNEDPGWSNGSGNSIIFE